MTSDIRLETARSYSGRMGETFDPRVTPWQIDASEFHELESRREQMEFLLRFAVLAPSSRNTQPWMFRVTDEGIDVFADFTRRLLTIDPDDRELLMSVGAAVANLRVAAAHYGFTTNVRYDVPPARALVASITVCETCLPDPGLASLFRAIPKRHTNRALFDHQPIDPRIWARIRDVLDSFPETFRVVLAEEKHQAAELIDYAERLLMTRPAMRAEMADWIRADGGLHTDGIPAAAFGVPRVLASGASWFVRQFKAGAWHGAHDRRLADSASALVIVCAGDDRVSLLQAGQALEQLLLTITDAGLQYSFLNQAIQMKSLRTRVQILAGSKRPAQLLIRIGSSLPADEMTPRRTVESVLTPTDLP